MGPEAWGVIGALVVVIGWVLRHLSKARKDFLGFLDNHLGPISENVKAMSENVKEMSVRTEKCPMIVRVEKGKPRVVIEKPIPDDRVSSVPDGDAGD